MRVLSTAWRYGLAVVSCGFALALAIPLDSPSSCFFLAVMVSSLYGGNGPGVLSVVLSSLAFDYFFLPPKYSFALQPFSSLQFATFLGSVLLIMVVIEAKRRSDEVRRQIDAKYQQVSADALAQAQKSEARLRLIINSIPVPAWSSRADGAADFINQRWLDYTGIPAEEALGWGWKVVCHPDDVDRTMEYWRSVLASHEDSELEARLRRFDGTYRWFLFRVSSLRDESGNVVQWYGTCIDIEDRKRAEDALSASELNFRLIVHSIPGLVVTLTPKGDVELVNWPVVDYTGLTLDELKDWSAAGLVPEEDLPLVLARWKQSVETGCEYDVEHRMRRADGTYRWFHVRGWPLRDNQGLIVCWYCLMTDIQDRKRTEEALRSREQQLRLMVDSIPALISIRTATGEVEMVNRQCVDYTGMTVDQLKNWPDVLHPDDRAETIAKWADCIASGQPLDTELRLRRADGVYRWFHARALPLRDTEGRIIRWHTLYVDIEDRKRAEEALRSSEHQLRLVVHSIPGFVCTETPAGVELVNPQFLDYTGKTFEEVQQWPTAGFIHDSDLSRVMDYWRYTRQTGEPRDIEYRIRRADGEFRWFHVRGLPSRDSSQTIVRWYYLFTDIEDRRQAEQALRASEHHLRLITETIPALVWRTTPDGEIDYVNRRVLEYTGKPLEHFGSAGWLQLLHPDDVDSTIRIWRHNTQTGDSHQVAYRLRRADGTYRWFDVRGEPLRDSEGRVVQWYGICIDMEDSKRIEEALRNTQERLSIASQIATVGELSASIAHEVNQPLTAVVSNGNACLRWLAAQPPNLAKAVEAAERIVRDGKGAGEVVRRIRALFKRAAHEEVSLDLNEVIGEVLGLLRGETAKRRVMVETDLGQNFPPVTGDRVQLQQLILNLLLNGIEAMDPVTDHPKRLFIRSIQQPDDTVLVEIRDSGVGLKDPDTVFEAFVTTKENGMGMGLAICRSIVQAHNGRLWAASGEGPGATFCFTLPLQLSPVS
jgi:PAS domain S-box-containing protein